MSEIGIFESPAAAAGKNEPEFNIPSDRLEAVKWVVRRLSKLTSDRLMTSHKIREVRLAAKNDGYSAETIAEAMRLGKMSPERRSKHADNLSKAMRLHGFEVSILDEDFKPDKLLNSHLAKLKSLNGDRTEIGQEMRELCRAAKDHGMDIPVLKQVVKLSKMDPEDRADWFAKVDNMGAIMQFW